jgi:hypothetical protein
MLLTVSIMSGAALHTSSFLMRSISKRRIALQRSHRQSTQAPAVDQSRYSLKESHQSDRQPKAYID